MNHTATDGRPHTIADSNNNVRTDVGAPSAAETCAKCGATEPDTVARWPVAGEAWVCDACWQDTCADGFWALMNGLAEITSEDI